jgi:hypothetical protein
MEGSIQCTFVVLKVEVIVSMFLEIVGIINAETRLAETPSEAFLVFYTFFIIRETIPETTH